ncbi:Nuclease-related domain-containing protein [Parafrankia irregularis]|uniref:Nuclease-related domain-containing protein n=2 Tax=Parafrankia irregularis TaxID=795642 RepID=A0A0S4QZ44_9ACTN|nr:NERD domain-containing protein [Parafrankia sp. CH37]CUU60489.1 Nuclease-related domain-containing protein [Parafrankia irregularis]
MDELLVRRWKRYGQHRLYVSLPDGRSVACFDRLTGRLTMLLDEVDRDAVLAVLETHGVSVPKSAVPVGPAEPVGPDGRVGPAVPGGMAVPQGPSGSGVGRSRAERRIAEPAAVNSPAATAHPMDLAAHRPGEAISAKLRELRPGFWRALADRLLRRARPETESWRTGLAGEQMVAAELAPLTARGWRLLHSIPLPRNVDIDHLLIGPGGVFTINTKYHRGRRIWVGDDAVRVGDGFHPYVLKARAEAVRASEALSRACGFGVGVAGVLAFVEAESLTVVPSLTDVLVAHHDDLRQAFDGVAGQWTAQDVELIFSAARDRCTWPVI